MDRTFVFGAAAVLFCLRDARLLGARPRLVFSFVPITGAAGAACGLAAESLSAVAASSLVGNVRFWLPATAIHAAQAYWCVRRNRLGRPPDWISALPGPLVVVAMVWAARLALVQVDGAEGLHVGAAIGLAYGAICGALGATGLVGRSPPDALRFGAVVHLSALLMIPALAAPDQPLGEQPVDWPLTAAVTAAIAALVLLSFAWHRYRFRRQ